jgi:hypothetical protein
MPSPISQYSAPHILLATSLVGLTLDRFVRGSIMEDVLKSRVGPFVECCTLMIARALVSQETFGRIAPIIRPLLLIRALYVLYQGYINDQANKPTSPSP